MISHEFFTLKTSKAPQIAAQINNNKIFVYKIIHDLRHPTVAL